MERSDPFASSYLDRKGLSEDVKLARKAEQVRRASRAADMALRALGRIYPEKFAALRREARRRVDAERGPLPGDIDGS